MIKVSISNICLVGILGFLCIGPWFNYLEYHNNYFSFPLGILLFELSFICLFLFFFTKIKFSLLFIVCILFFISYISFIDLFSINFDNNLEFIDFLRKNLRIFIISFSFSRFFTNSLFYSISINFFLLFVFFTLINNWHAYGLDFVDRNKSNCPSRTSLVYTVLVALTLKSFLDQNLKNHSLHFIFLTIFLLSISLGSRQMVLFSLISYIICLVFNKNIVILFVLLPIFFFPLYAWIVNVERLYNFSSSTSLENRYLFYQNIIELNLTSFFLGSRNMDSSLYPSHNLFAYFEQFGIILFLFYIIFIIFLFYKIFKLRSNPLRFTCLIFCFASLFSATFANYYIFFLSGILLNKNK